MAVTIHTTPQAYTPSDNNVLWSFSSNQTAQPNFEYRVEIRINSVLQYTAKVFPIQGAVSYFNAAEVLRGLIPAPTINSEPVVTPSDIDTLLFANQSFRTVEIKVIERYGTPIANQASATSSCVVWKSALNELQWLSFDHTNYALDTADKLFLTNFPRKHKYWIDPTKNNYLAFINNTPTFDIAARWVSADDADDYIFGIFGAGVYFMNFNLAKIADAIGTDFDKFAEVFMFDVGELPSFVPRSETFRFELYNGCVTDRTIYFLNKLGGIDSWIFSAKKEVNRNFERATFKKKLGTLSGNNYTYDAFQGREQNYHNASTETISLDSDWLHPDVHAWLVRELLESPLVWMEDQNGKKTRYIVSNASSEEGQDKYDVWRQLSLEIRPTLQSYSATL